VVCLPCLCHRCWWDDESLGADRFSPLTLTKCSGRGRVNRPLIYTCRAALSLDTLRDPQPFHTGSTKIEISFFHSKVFDVSVFTGRPDAFADWLWVIGSTTLLQRLDHGDGSAGFLYGDEFLYELQVWPLAVHIIIVNSNSVVLKLICHKMASFRISKSAIRWQKLRKHQQETL